jgi:DNA-binding NtrC family response regulator
MARTRKTILVLLSSEIDSEHTCRVLTDAGHVFVTATGERAGLAALAAVHFDVLLTDHCMTDADSSRYFCEVRRVSPWIAVVCIVGSSDDVASAAKMLECDATVQVPLSSARLGWVFDFTLRYFGS